MCIRDSVITAGLIENAMSYEAYRTLIDDLLSENRVTGNFMENSEEVLGYTKMNIARMRRGDKTFKIKAELKGIIQSISQQQIWLVITEGWCGDAAQSVPAIVKMAGLNPNIRIKFVLREEHLNLMDAYLTDGTRSIPKLIIINAESLEELGTWGPRPAIAQTITDDYKKKGTVSYQEYAQQLHKWYAKDKYQSIQAEIQTMLLALN